MRYDRSDVGHQMLFGETGIIVERPDKGRRVCPGRIKSSRVIVHTGSGWNYEGVGAVLQPRLFGTDRRVGRENGESIAMLRRS